MIDSGEVEDLQAVRSCRALPPEEGQAQVSGVREQEQLRKERKRRQIPRELPSGSVPPPAAPLVATETRVAGRLTAADGGGLPFRGRSRRAHQPRAPPGSAAAFVETTARAGEALRRILPQEPERSESRGSRPPCPDPGGWEKLI